MGTVRDGSKTAADAGCLFGMHRSNQTLLACWRADRDLAERTCLLAQEFKRIGCRLCWLCMKGFPERWIIILRAVYPWRNFPHAHLIGRVGDQ